MVVKADHRQLQLADHAVLVIARIADHGAAIGAAQNVIVCKAALARIVCTRQQLCPAKCSALDEQVGLRFGSETIDAVQIQRGRAHVGNFAGVIDHAVETGGGVQRDIVVHELAEEHHAHGHAVGPVVLGLAIHRPIGSADVLEYRLGRVGGVEFSEQAAEAVVALLGFVMTADAIGRHAFQRLHSMMVLNAHSQSPRTDCPQQGLIWIIGDPPQIGPVLRV